MLAFESKEVTAGFSLVRMNAFLRLNQHSRLSLLLPHKQPVFLSISEMSTPPPEVCFKRSDAFRAIAAIKAGLYRKDFLWKCPYQLMQTRLCNYLPIQILCWYYCASLLTSEGDVSHWCTQPPAHPSTHWSVCVVYRTAAALWSNRHIKEKIWYRGSNTPIVQHLYINYTVCIFFRMESGG